MNNKMILFICVILICYSNKDSGNIFVMPIEKCILAQK
nr:MAG TPA: Protein of unknown function (DUF1459) [Siphoviridae sp. ctEfY6]